MVAACTIVLLGAGARIRHFAAFVPVAAFGVFMAIMTSPYRVARITAFLDPYADPKGEGYHMIQSLATVSGGGVFGRGIGHGLQKFGYLPEDTTDFLFAVVCEEIGLVGAIIVVALYAGIVWTGTHIIARERNTLLKLVTLGIVGTFCVQALINLMVVTGLGPTKGIALPLMSSGGTGWILTAFMLGVVVSIDRTRDDALAEIHADEFAEGFAERTLRDGDPEIIVPDRAQLFGPLTSSDKAADHPEMQRLLSDQEIELKPRVRVRPKPMSDEPQIESRAERKSEPSAHAERLDQDEYEQLLFHDD
jgi:hypothetical protein